MSDLVRRVIRLEQQRPERRCAACRDWPPLRVEYVGDAGEGSEPAVRERCPGCGWAPTTIRVEYADDWRDTA